MMVTILIVSDVGSEGAATRDIHVSEDLPHREVGVNSDVIATSSL